MAHEEGFTMRRKAQRIAAWMTLAFVLLGVLLCLRLYSNSGRALRGIDWSIVPSHLKIPLFLQLLRFWLPAGVILNALAVVAFFQESAGIRSPRLLRNHTIGMLALVALMLAFGVYTTALGTIQIGTSASFRCSSVGPILAGMILCLPLITWNAICLIWRGESAGHLCNSCDYDLTGNVSGVCPECGTPVLDQRADRAEASKEALWRRRCDRIMIGLLLICGLLGAGGYLTYERQQAVRREANDRLVRQYGERLRRQILDESRQQADAWAIIKVGQAVPELELIAIDGRLIRSTDLHGKVVLLNFFATWCGPCRQEMPRLADLWRRYKNRGFLVIGVATGEDQTLAKIEEFRTEIKIPFALVLDKEKKLFARFTAGGIPRSFLIGRTGQVAYHCEGYSDVLEPEFRKLIQAIEQEVDKSGGEE